VIRWICEGDSVVVGPSVYRTTGVYTDVLVNRYGCDSVVTLNLTVHPVYEQLRSETICEGDSIVIGGMSYTETGIYENRLSTQYGCDSLVTLNLHVLPGYVKATVWLLAHRFTEPPGYIRMFWLTGTAVIPLLP